MKSTLPLNRALLAALMILVGGTSACKTTADCEPDTVRVLIPCGESQPDAIRISVAKDDEELKALDDLTVTCPTTTVTLKLAAYKDVKHVKVVVIPVKGQEDGKPLTAEIDLKAGCTLISPTDFKGPDEAGNDGGIGDAESMPGIVTCGAETHLCGDTCVSNKDPATCGTSCSACQLPTNGTAECDGTRCQGKCAADKQLCAGQCIPKEAACDNTCPSGTHACNGLCPQDSDPNSCGSTCSPCAVPAGAQKATCAEGKCDFVCNTGYHRCDNTCKKDDDSSACGSMCKQCASDPNGTGICSGETCSLECKTGFHLCGTQCVSNTSPLSCGTSCTACTVPNGGQATCDGTKCGTVCPSGMKVCMGACVDNGSSCGGCPSGSHDCSGICADNSHVNSCGTSSCTPCPVPAGANQATCTAGKCSFICGSGFHACGDTCKKDDDILACGASCEKCNADPNGTPVCTSGTCGTACKSGFHLCGNVCVTNNSIDHCGGSCGACLTAPTAGVATCDGTRCDAACPDTSKPQLCAGACIAANAACSGKCPAGKHNCSGSCVPDDSSNSCGTLCYACALPNGAASNPCLNATTCSVTCTSGYHKCGNLCPSDTDASACGSGCIDCPKDPNGSPKCQGGLCGLNCNSGFHECDKKCVSNSALATCGQSCNTPCGPDPSGGKMTCDGSSCVPTCPTAGQRLCNNACIPVTTACNGDCSSVPGTRSCGGQCKANDTNACGTGCDQCATSASVGTGSAQCNGTSCSIKCGGSTTRECSAGVCVSPSHPACCGNSDCTQPPAGGNRLPTCSGYSCSYPCTSNTRDCGGVCKPNDTNACGGSCQKCNGPINGTGTATCNGTSCDFDCTGSTPNKSGSSCCASSGVCTSVGSFCAANGSVVTCGIVNGCLTQTANNACNGACEKCTPNGSIATCSDVCTTTELIFQTPISGYVNFVDNTGYGGPKTYDVNLGGGLSVGSGFSLGEARGFLSFDLSGIGGGRQIKSASLTLSDVTYFVGASNPFDSCGPLWIDSIDYGSSLDATSQDFDAASSWYLQVASAPSASFQVDVLQPVAASYSLGASKSQFRLKFINAFHSGNSRMTVPAASSKLTIRSRLP